MFSYFAHTCVILFQCGFFLLACYYFVISLFSLFPTKKQSASTEKLRFAIVIPAHNEEKSLPGLLKSLQEQTYPQSLFTIFVMADHCTDRTYDTALHYGATPLQRKSAVLSGKGAALEDAFSQINTMPIAYDAFVVIDADNVADARFLEEINYTMQEGVQAVQGYIDSKNPNSNWLSHAYSSWYWLSNRIFQMGYSKLGFGCKLGGTGFALSRELLLQVPWKTSTMAEDAEYTLLLSLQNKRISYAPRAIIFDEKPTNLSTSLKQRIRWAQGITQVQRNFCCNLLKQGKWNAFFRFWSDLLFPLCFILFLILNFFSITNLLELTTVSFVNLWTKPIPFLVLNIYLVGTVLVAVRGLFLDKKWNVKMLFNLFGSFLFLITWLPAGFLGIIKHNKQEWYHTKHHASI